MTVRWMLRVLPRNDFHVPRSWSYNHDILISRAKLSFAFLCISLYGAKGFRCSGCCIHKLLVLLVIDVERWTWTSESAKLATGWARGLLGILQMIWWEEFFVETFKPEFERTVTNIDKWSIKEQETQPASCNNIRVGILPSDQSPAGRLYIVRYKNLYLFDLKFYALSSNL